MSKRLARRVLLLGWDAADWKIIRPLLERGEMPVLQHLIENGVSGNLGTLFPVISPILWNSIATGKRADKHEILGFIEPTPDGAGARPVSSTSRRAKAFWNILSQSGMRSGTINWFASYPAEPVAGEIFTNRFPHALQATTADYPPLDEHAVYPPDLRELAESFRVHPRDITSEQLLSFFPDGLPSDLNDPRLGMLARLLSECATVQNAAACLAAGDDWDLLSVYYETVDHAGHGFMEYFPPAMAHVSPEDAAAFGYIVKGVYRFHDMLLGRMLELVGPETTVLLISDHGFHSDHLRPPVPRHFRDPRDKFGVEMNPVAWHRQQGVFVAAGPGIKRDELIHGASLLDIAPTILALLGLPVADDMDGRALTRIFAEEIEPDRIASYEPPHPDDGVHRGLSAEESDPFAARQAMEQLAALGYIEMPDANDPGKQATEAVWERRWNLGQVYFSSGRYAEAAAILRELLAERDQPQLRCHLALALLHSRRAAEAEALIAPLLAVENPTPLARLIAGRARLRQGDPGEALKWLEPLRGQEEHMPYLSMALGQTYLRCRMFAEAEQAFRRALERDEDNAEAHDGLGLALRRQGRYEDAVYEHMRSAALQHGRVQTHVNLGIALSRTGQVDWAIRAFEQAVELAPDEPFPHRCLARLYHGPKQDRTRARHHAVEMLRCRKLTREPHAV